MGRDPRQRYFPDIDLSLHSLAVAANDKLNVLLRQQSWTTADILQLKELMNMLLLIKKSIKVKKKLTEKKIEPIDKVALLG